jgi:hypothetical protein
VKPQFVPFSKLLPSEMTGSLQLLEVLKSDVLFATIVFRSVGSPLAYRPPLLFVTSAVLNPDVLIELLNDLLLSPVPHGPAPDCSTGIALNSIVSPPFLMGRGVSFAPVP